MLLKARLWTVVAIVLALIAQLDCAHAQSPVEQFYKGRSVPILVGFAPGGVSDISARLVARHLPRFIPGYRGTRHPGRSREGAAERLLANGERPLIHRGGQDAWTRCQSSRS